MKATRYHMVRPPPALAKSPRRFMVPDSRPPALPKSAPLAHAHQTGPRPGLPWLGRTMSSRKRFWERTSSLILLVS
jgi:hypothetical protein